MKVKSIAIDQIEQNENSRVSYKTVDLAELMSSMKKNGLLQPIGVRELKNGKYECVFGNRRLVAAKKLGWSDIDAHCMDELTTDIDRDIVGLIENFKRQSTSVQEDGRMFQSLIDRGLSINEIAIRLDVGMMRIRTALDVVSVVSPDLRSKIVYSQKGKRRVKGQIPASTAAAVLNIRKGQQLNRRQTRAMLNYAADHQPSISQLLKIGPLIKSGKTVHEAIELVSTLEHFSIHFYIQSDHCAKLEKKYGKKIATIVREYIEKNEEFKIETRDTLPSTARMHSETAATILRKGPG
jgi:ParB/RepB/Spo0J family partition protein